MPAYRIMLSRGGQRSVVVIDADSEQDAVEHILSTGASVLAVEEVRVQVHDAEHAAPHLPQAQPVVPYPVRAPAPARTQGVSDWSGFWSFRWMLTPSTIRCTFIIASVCLLALFVVYPIVFVQQYSKVGAVEAAAVRHIESALPRIRSLREQWRKDRSEADQLALQQGYKEAAAEARSRAAKSEAALNQALREASIGWNQSEDEALASARQALQNARKSGPQVRDLALNLGAALVMWIIFRVMCECSIVFFRIHEQTVAISDRLRGMGGP